MESALRWPVRTNRNVRTHFLLLSVDTCFVNHLPRGTQVNSHGFSSDGYTDGFAEGGGGKAPRRRVSRPSNKRKETCLEYNKHLV